MSQGRRCLGLLLIALTGCGGPTVYPVSGVVTLDDVPINLGMVEYIPVEPGPAARGQIRSGGAYTLSTYGDDDGVPPGDYVVIVSQPQLISSLRMAPEEHQAQHEHEQNQLGVVPRRYAMPGESGLRVTVEAGPNEHRLSLQLHDEKEG